MDLPIVTRDVPVETACKVAELLRAKIEQSPIAWQDHHIAVTVCIGVAVIEGSDDIEQLIRSADLALYNPKSRGRNQVVPSQDENSV